MPAPADWLDRLAPRGQAHLLAGWDGLDAAGQAQLLAQLQAIDFDQLAELYARRDEPAPLPAADAIRPIPTADNAIVDPFHLARGEEALAAGELAVLVVAGGQGTRLGFDAPKGLFPVGPVSGASLFQIHAEKVLGLSRRTGHYVPMLVMTSPATHAETVAFFDANADFGLAPGQVQFFTQGTMPALDLATGRVLLERPGAVFASPDGHGGALTALADSGLLGKLLARGVTTLSYFQVDNPLVAIADAGFLGRHLSTGSQVSTKVVFKESPGEKVGVLALVNGRCTILEYSDLPPELAAATDDQHRLVHRAGNTAIHLFDLQFLQALTAGRGRLPFHLARKKVPHYDADAGRAVTPAAENALKFERFIFDALPLAERWQVVAVDRAEEFAPLKNAAGADSPGAVKRAITEQAARWLMTAGVSTPRDADGHPAVALEVRPTVAQSAAELRQWVAAQPGYLAITESTLIDRPLSE